MAEKLTDARVRAAKSRDKRYSIMDTKEPGLELRVHADGRCGGALAVKTSA
jgi:hypothetical protein